MRIDRELLHELFDVPEEDGPGRLVLAARRAHYTLPYLVFSVLESEGVPLGAAGAELARARRRAEHYRRLEERLRGDQVRALKGSRFAARYPGHVFRPQGDLDLLVRTEEQLWRLAARLAETPPMAVSVSVLGAPRQHVVTLNWAPEEPLVDPELKVDLLTAAFTGDQDAIPLRAELPEDPALADLLCLAAERLERAYHLRDALDLYVLAGTEPPPAPAVLAAARDYHLGPELLELIEYTAARLPVPAATWWLPPLREEAERELARRVAHQPPPVAASTEEALARGDLLYGMPLGGQPSWTGPGAQAHGYGGEALLRTPLGDYLLVSGLLVAPERFEAAQGELALLRG